MNQDLCGLCDSVLSVRQRLIAKSYNITSGLLTPELALKVVRL